MSGQCRDRRVILWSCNQPRRTDQRYEPTRSRRSSIFPRITREDIHQNSSAVSPTSRRNESLVSMFRPEASHIHGNCRVRQGSVASPGPTLQKFIVSPSPQIRPSNPVPICVRHRKRRDGKAPQQRSKRNYAERPSVETRVPMRSPAITRAMFPIFL